MKKSVVVTGSSGLIGSRFFEEFSKQYELIPVSLTDGTDLLDPASCSQIAAGKDVSAVVHLAAFTDVSGAYEQRGDESGTCYQLNVNATQNVVDLANRLQAHLVHISTDFVFNGRENKTISETDSPSPIEWYGETKLRAEQLVADHANSWTIMRIAFPFFTREGVRPDLVSSIGNKLKAGDTLYLFGDQTITPTFVDDVIHGISRMIECAPPKEIFHVMGPQSLSPYTLGTTVASCLDLSAENIVKTSLVEYLKKDPRPRQQYLSMDTSKYVSFCKAHGFDVPLSVREAFS